MLDSVDYLCITGGTAQMVLFVSALGDASMRLRWTALAHELHCPEDSSRVLPWVTPQDRCEKGLANPLGDKPQMAALRENARSLCARR